MSKTTVLTQPSSARQMVVNFLFLARTSPRDAASILGWTATTAHTRSGNEIWKIIAHIIATFCEAAAYGCEFTAKIQAMDEHFKSCPLAKLVPFLKAQNDRLEAHGKALDLLRAKNHSLEAVLYSITETLDTFESQQLETEVDSHETVSDNPEPYDSTTHHLLSGHESLRRDVDQMSIEISNLDAKASTMILNESLHAKHELAYANAAISSIRMQLNWLMSDNHHRGFSIRSQPISTAESVQLDAPVATNEPRRPLGPQPTRRLSDDARQEPKL
ncbi:MAG: hypothetical protein Q9166_006624 [cf. Caloplaca sp. 2 TL-2023]